MQILKIEFENVNSLAGKWTVDFSDPAFAREGLFAIVGPTGAGKTTILDAISLGLYGRTVRQEDATNNELGVVMTHGTNLCECKVTFIGADGNRCRAEWKITRKTRKGADGGMNLPEVKLYEIGDGSEKQVDGNKKEIVKKIVEKVGLDFGQFQRSMMLAQGQFDKFISSSDKERSEILEQATGTEIYTRLGQRIFQKTSEAKKNVEDIKIKQGENIPLGEEARGKLEADEREADGDTRRKRAEIDSLAKELAWINADIQLKKDAAALQDREEETARRAAELEPRSAFLARAELAAKFDVAYSELNGASKVAKSSAAALPNKTAAVADARANFEQLQGSMPGLEEARRAAEEARANAEPLIAEARKLDGDKSLAMARLGHADENRRSAANGLADLKSRIEHLEGAIANAAATAGYLDAALSGSPLPEARGLNNIVVSKVARRAELVAMSAGVIATEKAALAKLESARARYDAEKPNFEALDEQIKKRIVDAGRILEVVKGLKVEQARLKLKDGDRCPICGNTYHETGVRLPEKSEFEKAYEDATEAKRKNDAKIESIRKEMADAEEAARVATAKRESETKELDGINSELEGWRTKARTAVEERTAGLTEAKGQVAEAERFVTEAEDALAKARAELAGIEKRRAAIPSVPADVGAYEKSLGKAVDDSARRLADAEKNLAIAREQLAARENELAAAKADAQAKEEARKAAEDGFIAAIAEKGFASEAEWISARGDPRDLEAIRREKSALESDKARLEEARRNHEANVERHSAEPSSERSPEEVAALKAEAESGYDVANQKIGEIRQSLADDDEKRARGAELAGELAKAEATSALWKRLNGMLGGKNGDGFRMYAQGITLRALLKAANPFLGTMTGGRYELEWHVLNDTAKKDAEDVAVSPNTLLPVVIDHFQHDTERKLSNVSGGERFEVSLALALGLSEILSGRVKIETMFLDEGFGTLDPDRLDAAIDVLCSLHRDGTTIGVISHVKAVEERMPLKIRAKTSADGHGSLRGEGGIESAVRKG